MGRDDRGEQRVAIGLGSNLGDRLGHLQHARTSLRSLLSGRRWSSVYRTLPQHVREQPEFLNACVTGGTRLSAHELLMELQRIEADRGRDRTGARYGPRSLDLDILLYGGEIVDDPGLRVPHPRLAERAFALVPLGQIAADWVHPELALPVSELLARSRLEGVEPYIEGWDSPTRATARAAREREGR